MVCGSREFISRAVRYRKMLGGGMRQTGWLAACGRVALTEENVRLLKKDHENARALAEGIAGLRGIRVDLEKVHTNYVMIAVTGGREARDRLHRELETRKILTTKTGDRIIRCVTSRQVDGEDVRRAVESFRAAAGSS
jgi:threonine aldolase